MDGNVVGLRFFLILLSGGIFASDLEDDVLRTASSTHLSELSDTLAPLVVTSDGSSAGSRKISTSSTVSESALLESASSHSRKVSTDMEILIEKIRVATEAVADLDSAVMIPDVPPSNEYLEFLENLTKRCRAHDGLPVMTLAQGREAFLNVIALDIIFDFKVEPSDQFVQAFFRQRKTIINGFCGTPSKFLNAITSTSPTPEKEQMHQWWAQNDLKDLPAAIQKAKASASRFDRNGSGPTARHRAFEIFVRSPIFAPILCYLPWSQAFEARILDYASEVFSSSFSNDPRAQETSQFLLKMIGAEGANLESVQAALASNRQGVDEQQVADLQKALEGLNEQADFSDNDLDGGAAQRLALEQGFAARLSEVQGELAAVGRQVASTAYNVAFGARERVPDFNRSVIASLESIESSFVAHKDFWEQQIAALKADRAKVQSELRLLEQKCVQTQKDLEGALRAGRQTKQDFSAEVERYQMEVQALEANVSKLEQSKAQIQSLLDTQGGTLQSEQEKATGLQRSLEELKAQLAEEKDAVEAAEDQAGILAFELGTVQSQLKACEALIEELKRKDDQNHSWVKAVSETLGLGTADAPLAGIAGKVKALQEQNTRITAELNKNSSVTDAYKETQERVSALEALLESEKGRVAGLEAALEQEKMSVAALQESDEAGAVQLRDVKSKLSATQLELEQVQEEAHKLSDECEEAAQQYSKKEASYKMELGQKDQAYTRLEEENLELSTSAQELMQQLESEQKEKVQEKLRAQEAAQDVSVWRARAEEAEKELASLRTLQAEQTTSQDQNARLQAQLQKAQSALAAKGVELTSAQESLRAIATDLSLGGESPQLEDAALDPRALSLQITKYISDLKQKRSTALLNLKKAHSAHEEQVKGLQEQIDKIQSQFRISQSEMQKEHQRALDKVQGDLSAAHAALQKKTKEVNDLAKEVRSAKMASLGEVYSSGGGGAASRYALMQDEVEVVMSDDD